MNDSFSNQTSPSGATIAKERSRSITYDHSDRSKRVLISLVRLIFTFSCGKSVHDFFLYKPYQNHRDLCQKPTIIVSMRVEVKPRLHLSKPSYKHQYGNTTNLCRLISHLNVSRPIGNQRDAVTKSSPRR
ncbi:hypothetical protein AVEN_147549-1 [Araneus ventricosus]|uniref:Uncharacterized protein n=1 Tax=Araneus ventricosus TaxID=182803 RepID=A0A4Y2VDP5_ARAVE|nr:hypothetical protein AVEN_147549-1 [Araneus ventricosus]